ncbi:MAG: radical SAM protein [Desulfocapsa sp.]|nr:radical SAM protein [Desulfocapsa sp.]MBN4048682.1 radical SAM protein [bacterium AH-315-N22]
MQLYNLEFTEEEIKKAVAGDRLLSIEIEFSRICNFRCSYCYVPEKKECKGELSTDEIKNVIVQAKELGARKIIILGGEPSIYPHLPEMLKFIDSHGFEIEMFTNGTGVNAELAQLLAALKVRLVLKLNSRNRAVQDRLAGKEGAYDIIQTAFAHLKDAGYPSDDLFLALSTIICQPNFDELVDMWKWVREQKIEPYFEVITPQENALDNLWLSVDSIKLKELFAELSRIDQNLYGRDWEPQPPLVGNKCMRHQVSCLVTATGEVMPCVGVTIPLDNIRNNTLAYILKNSEVVQNLKNYREMIKGECRDCDKAAECYGCRGAAYQLTGDYLASDPTCWRNQRKTGSEQE